MIAKLTELVDYARPPGLSARGRHDVASGLAVTDLKQAPVFVQPIEVLIPEARSSPATTLGSQCWWQ